MSVNQLNEQINQKISSFPSKNLIFSQAMQNNDSNPQAVCERFREFVMQSGGIARVAEKSGIGDQVIRQVVNGRNRPGPKTLSTIAQHYPDFDANYIITGERSGGAPPKKETVDLKADAERGGDGYLIENEFLKKQIELLERQISQLSESYNRLAKNNDYLLQKAGFKLGVSCVRDDSKTVNLTAMLQRRDTYRLGYLAEMRA